MTEPALHSPAAAEAAVAPKVGTISGVRRRTAVASREAAVDNLRVALSALVVAHHGLQPYGYNQNWWVIERVPPVPVLGLFLWVNACYFMGLFFLIAGRTIAVDSLDTCLVEAFICTGLSVGLLVACRELWNGPGRVSALAPDTYAVYVFHVAVLVALQHALLSVPVGALAKAAIVVPAGIVLSFAFCHFVVRRVPGARGVF